MRSSQAKWQVDLVKDVLPFLYRKKVSLYQCLWNCFLSERLLLQSSMHFFISTLLLLLTPNIRIHASVLPSYLPDPVDGLAAVGLLKLAAYEITHRKNSTCTLAKAVKRREWQVHFPFMKLQLTSQVGLDCFSADLVHQCSPLSPVTTTANASLCRSRSPVKI